MRKGQVDRLPATFFSHLGVSSAVSHSSLLPLPLSARHFLPFAKFIITAGVTSVAKGWLELLELAMSGTRQPLATPHRDCSAAPTASASTRIHNSALESPTAFLTSIITLVPMCYSLTLACVSLDASIFHTVFWTRIWSLMCSVGPLEGAGKGSAST